MLSLLLALASVPPGVILLRCWKLSQIPVAVIVAILTVIKNYETVVRFRFFVEVLLPPTTVAFPATWPTAGSVLRSRINPAILEAGRV